MHHPDLGLEEEEHLEVLYRWIHSRYLNARSWDLLCERAAASNRAQSASIDLVNIYII